MIEKDGKDNKGNQHWKLYVPDEHCNKGLEVTITETDKGLNIGDGTILFSEIARLTQANTKIDRLCDALLDAANWIDSYTDKPEAEEYRKIVKEIKDNE